jgi:NCS1 family nucleobase:cation symporter-1
MASLIKTTIQHLQVKPDGEIHPPGLEGKWGNRDIFPVPPEQRTFNIISYFSFWAIAGMSVSSWAFGGSLLTLGLSVGEGIGAGFIAATFVAIFTYTCGYPGASRNLGYDILIHVKLSNSDHPAPL